MVSELETNNYEKLKEILVTLNTVSTFFSRCCSKHFTCIITLNSLKKVNVVIMLI